MDLKELRYFRAIAEFGTLSKASAYLRVAQPALSRQMRKLEHSLGVDLLRRTSKGVSVTTAGQALLERTIRLEQQLDEARREVSRFAEEVTGILRIAVQFPLSELAVPRLVGTYRARYPHVALHIFEAYSGEITDALLNERLDIAIVDPPSHVHADLTNMPLWVDKMSLVGPMRADFAGPFETEQLGLTELIKLPIIMPHQTSALRRLVDNAFARQHLRFQPVIEADGPRMIAEMVNAGLGYTIFPRQAFYPMEMNGQLRSREISPAIHRTLSIVTRTALVDDRAVSPFIQLIRDMAVQIAQTERFSTSQLYQDTLDKGRGAGGTALGQGSVASGSAAEMGYAKTTV